MHAQLTRVSDELMRRARWRCDELVSPPTERVFAIRSLPSVRPSDDPSRPEELNDALSSNEARRRELPATNRGLLRPAAVPLRSVREVGTGAHGPAVALADRLRRLAGDERIVRRDGPDLARARHGSQASAGG